MIAVLGADPGVSGGIAVLSGDGAVAGLWALRPDMTEDQVVDICAVAAGVIRAYQSRMGFFEKVQHMTGDGAKGSHTFGYIKGLMRGCLKSHGVILVDVYPQMWQAYMDCMSGGDKNVTKRRAIALFPDLGKMITHATADALLIAEYGRQKLLL